MSYSVKSTIEGWTSTARRWAAEPQSLQHVLRESQPAQILFCVGLGLAVGLVTIVLHDLVLIGREVSFDLDEGARLSSSVGVSRWRIAYVPALGGLVLALFSMLMTWLRPSEIVDPIEANAIYGGRMSVMDSIRLMLQALISNVAGVSVGMEAAYTQIGSAVCSWAGRHLQLRRDDVRIFVAAGAAAAIAAAFNAPLAGAFYGFELVLGIYTVAALPQIAICALTSALLVRAVTGGEPIFTLPLELTTIPLWNFPLFAVMGVLSAQIGIITMKLVTICEHLTKRLPVPVWLQPALGGCVVSAIAIVFPQVLGSGQGAINNHLQAQWPLILVGLLLAAKIVASAVSIGSGFRGGLFSSSLLIGCLFGQCSGILAGVFVPHAAAGPLESFMLVGMGAVGTSIVGAPVTMVLLVLEMTGNYPATTAVMIGVLVSSFVTRYSFGYSFSTWRFHLRGLRITGAYDIGWIGELTVESLMQTAPTAALASMSLADLRAAVPPGSAKHIYVVDVEDHYMGVVDVADIHNQSLTDTETMTALDLAKGVEFYLLPQQNISEAIDLFSQAEMEELPVLRSARDVRIIGALSEPYTLKRYARELESRNLAQSGARAPVTTP